MPATIKALSLLLASPKNVRVFSKSDGFSILIHLGYHWVKGTGSIISPNFSPIVAVKKPPLRAA
jgi:hypothetical protein